MAQKKLFFQTFLKSACVQLHILAIATLLSGYPPVAGQHRQLPPPQHLPPHGPYNQYPIQGSIFQNYVSAENFSDKSPASNFGQKTTQKTANINFNMYEL
jgi:hypothetical protein